MKKYELLNVIELLNTNDTACRPKGCRQVSRTAKNLSIVTTRTLMVLTSAILVCLTLSMQFSPQKAVAQEKITVVLYDVDRETTSEVQKWIEVLSKKTNQVRGKTGVNFSFEVVSVKPGSLDQQVLALLRPQNKPGCFLLVNGNMIKSAAEKGSPLVVLSDPKTFGKQSVKREHILLNFDAGHTGAITTSGIATTSQPMKFMSEQSAYQRQSALIPYIPYFSLENAESDGVNEQVNQDENQSSSSSSGQSWRDWFQNKVLSTMGIFINAACNATDGNDEFTDYFGKFIGWGDMLD